MARPSSAKGMSKCFYRMLGKCSTELKKHDEEAGWITTCILDGSQNDIARALASEATCSSLSGGLDP